jgi:heme O synthase-like polyprenyltransferase
MLPVKVGLRRPSTIVLSLNILTVAFSFLFPLLRLTGFVYSVIALAAGAMFLLQNRGLLISTSEVDGFSVCCFNALLGVPDVSVNF